MPGQTCQGAYPGARQTVARQKLTFQSRGKLANVDLPGARRRRPYLRIRGSSTSPSVVPGDLAGQGGDVPLELPLASLTATQPRDRGFANVRALKRGDTLLLILAAHPSTPATNKNTTSCAGRTSPEGTPYSPTAEERGPPGPLPHIMTFLSAPRSFSDFCRPNTLNSRLLLARPQLVHHPKLHHAVRERVSTHLRPSSIAPRLGR
jgi:hypothetical protein